MRITVLLVTLATLTACGRGAVVRSAPSTRVAAPTEAQLVLQGSISYPEKVAMAPNVMVRITVVDISSDGDTGVVASTELFPEGRQVPLAYRLEARRSLFKKGRRYQVNVRITEGKVLRFITKKAHPLDVDQVPARFDILVNAVPQRLW
jgi:putative lipoprotein